MKEQIKQMLSTGLEQIQNLQIQATGKNIEIVRLCISTFLDTYKWVDALELPDEKPVDLGTVELEPEQPEQEEQNDDGREI